MAASALEGSGRVKSDLGKSGQDDSSSPTYVVGNSGPEENNEFLAVFRNPHLKSNIGDSDESQNGVEEVEKAGIPLYLPKIPLYLPKMPFFSLSITVFAQNTTVFATNTTVFATNTTVFTTNTTVFAPKY